jgi:hypothetical protein
MFSATLRNAILTEMMGLLDGGYMAALYKYPQYLKTSTHDAFDAIHEAADLRVMSSSQQVDEHY